MTGALLQALFALLAVLGLIVLVAALVRGGLGRRLGPLLPQLTEGRRLRVVERRPVDPRSTLLLVEVDGVEYAVLTTAGGPLLLTQRPQREKAP